MFSEDERELALSLCSTMARIADTLERLEGHLAQIMEVVTEINENGIRSRTGGI